MKRIREFRPETPGSQDPATLPLAKAQSVGGEKIVFSKVMRQGHMYVALFLTPWMLMYALSTIGLNHYSFFRSLHRDETARFTVEREVPYTRTFPPGTPVRTIGRQIVIDLHMDGGHTANRQKTGEIVVDRSDPISPRRITYDPARRRLVIEKESLGTMDFLTRLHTRVGYSTRYWINSAWAATVDLSIAATFFWIASGFWLWWEMKRTRRLGVILTLAGLVLFGLFVIVN
jgi:hypothetical protein